MKERFPKKYRSSITTDNNGNLTLSVRVKSKACLTLCPNCGYYIYPELQRNKNNNQKEVHFTCQKCNKKGSYLLEKYISIMQIIQHQDHHCNIHKNVKSGNFQFCLSCKKWLCPTCIINHNKENKNEGHEMLHNIIDINLFNNDPSIVKNVKCYEDYLKLLDKKLYIYPSNSCINSNKCKIKFNFSVDNESNKNDNKEDENLCDYYNKNIDEILKNVTPVKVYINKFCTHNNLNFIPENEVVKFIKAKKIKGNESLFNFLNNQKKNNNKIKKEINDTFFINTVKNVDDNENNLNNENIDINENYDDDNQIFNEENYNYKIVRKNDEKLQNKIDNFLRAYTQNKNENIDLSFGFKECDELFDNNNGINIYKTNRNGINYFVGKLDNKIFIKNDYQYSTFVLENEVNKSSYKSNNSKYIYNNHKDNDNEDSSNSSNILNDNNNNINFQKNDEDNSFLLKKRKVK